MPVETVPMDCPTQASILRAYRDAIACQDACNLSGVARSFAAHTDALWTEARAFGQGTDHVNRHPVAVLVLSKLLDLTGCPTPDRHYTAAYVAVSRILENGQDAIGSDVHRGILATYRDSVSR